MLILGIETSGLLCSVAWYKENRTLLEYNIEREKIHGSLLANLVEDGLKYLNLKTNDISLIAIATGPGSYTGLRIGMSYCKGLCYGLNIPIIGISNFQVLRIQAPICNSLVVTLINANRGKYYYACFNNNTATISEMGIINDSEIERLAKNNTGLIIDYHSHFDPDSNPWSKFSWIQRGRFNTSFLCRAAENAYNTSGAVDLGNLEPLYLQSFAGVL